MKNRDALVILPVVLVLVGCGGGTGKPQPLTCGTAEFAMEGTVDGSPISQRIPVAGQALVNTASDANCYLNLYFTQGGRLRFEWPSPIDNNVPSAASGSINLEAQNGINVGNCTTDGFVSEFTLQPTGVTFTLKKQLYQAPYCGGTAVAGEISGCANFKQ